KAMKNVKKQLKTQAIPSCLKRLQVVAEKVCALFGVQKNLKMLGILPNKKAKPLLEMTICIWKNLLKNLAILKFKSWEILQEEHVIYLKEIAPSNVVIKN